METSVPGNLLEADDCGVGEETMATLVKGRGFTLEHIVSRGAASPEGYWYDQDRAEWVLLLRGEAELRFESGETHALSAGGHLVIPAHCRHRVEHTSPDALWLALHYE